MWAVAAGIVVGAYGLGYLIDGRNGLSSPRNAQLLDLWGGYFKTYMWIGTLWIFTGLGFLSAAPALWKGRNWGRKVGIVSALGTVIGWLVIKIACLHFDVPPPMIVLIAALPAGYLFARPIREFCARN